MPYNVSCCPAADLSGCSEVNWGAGREKSMAVAVFAALWLGRVVIAAAAAVFFLVLAGLEGGIKDIIGALPTG